MRPVVEGMDMASIHMVEVGMDTDTEEEERMLKR
jgi:hypothetical protein